MVKARDTLCIAGAPDRVPAHDPWRYHEGRATGIVMTFAADDGRPIHSLALPSMPVQHGMRAAGESLYLTCTSGDVVRIGEQQQMQ